MIKALIKFNPNASGWYILNEVGDFLTPKGVFVPEPREARVFTFQVQAIEFCKIQGLEISFVDKISWVLKEETLTVYLNDSKHNSFDAVTDIDMNMLLEQHYGLVSAQTPRIKVIAANLMEVRTLYEGSEYHTFDPRTKEIYGLQVGFQPLSKIDDSVWLKFETREVCEAYIKKLWG